MSLSSRDACSSARRFSSACLRFRPQSYTSQVTCTPTTLSRFGRIGLRFTVATFVSARLTSGMRSARLSRRSRSAFFTCKRASRLMVKILEHKQNQQSAMMDVLNECPPRARILAYVTGRVNQELLLKNEYLAAENRILRSHL